jgi:hypothetical protein
MSVSDTDKTKNDWTVVSMAKNPTNIQTGYLYTTDGKKFDVSVILNFPNESDYENCSLYNFPKTNLVDYYFGEPNESDTKLYVKRFVERQTKFENLYQKLLELFTANPDDTEIRDQIDFVKSLIVDIH